MVRANWTALPTVLFSAALVAGEALGFAFHMFAGLWGWGALLTVLVMSVSVGWRIPRLAHLIVFCLGITLAWRAEYRRYSLDGYAKSVAEDGGAPGFLLRVEGDAHCRKGRKGRRFVSFGSDIGNVPVKVIAPLPAGGAVPADGELWRCRGWLSLRKGSASRYSRRTLWVTEKDPLERVSAAGARSAESVYRRLSEDLSRRTKAGVGWPREIRAFADAMLLGRREDIPYGRLAVFAAAGTIHVFAISGLHVMLIAGLLKGLLRSLGLSKRMCAACVIPALAAYVMLIGSPPSAVRAAVMTSLYFGAHLFGRKPDSLAAWALALIVICGISPEMILDVGCVLSFAVMLGIVLWIRWSGQFASPADGLLVLAKREEQFRCVWRKRMFLWLYRKASWILGGLGISFAAWVAGAPVAARVFERLALGSVAVNVVIVPLAGVTVALGVFGLAASFVLPHLGMLFNDLAALCIFLMSWISEKVAAMPGSSVETLPWSWGDCLMWYVAWFCLFALLSRHLPGKERVLVKEWEVDDDSENG